ncbi:MAG TPA: transglutaminase family protein [Candidatus Bathyarchaeia archaeon]|nr:transglutaminase family protein [Candidatus Bathyarchaeia archaeon]
MEDLEEYLSVTKLIDSNHQLVRTAALRIAGEAGTPKDAAVKLFSFVRDKIPLAIVNPWKTASETLRMRKGSCLTKATLQVALLRSVGIPARFRVVEFKGNDPAEWRGIVPSFSVSRLPERWSHIFVEVYIEGRWIMADATFDKALVPDTDDWDGEKDVCCIEPQAVLADLGAFVSIEEEARKLDKAYKAPVFWIIDGYKTFWLLNLYQRIQRLKNRLKHLL